MSNNNQIDLFGCIWIRADFRKKNLAPWHPSPLAQSQSEGFCSFQQFLYMRSLSGKLQACCRWIFGVSFIMCWIILKQVMCWIMMKHAQKLKVLFPTATLIHQQLSRALFYARRSSALDSHWMMVSVVAPHTSATGMAAGNAEVSWTWVWGPPPSYITTSFSWLGASSFPNTSRASWSRSLPIGLGSMKLGSLHFCLNCLN